MFVAVFDGRNLHLAFALGVIRSHRFEVQFCSEKKEKIDALKGTM
jgi:hypothetical protein